MTQHKTPRDIAIYLQESFSLYASEVNWALQIKLAKSLLTKYSYDEIIYAINYYKSKGVNLYSLGFLKYKDNMKNPVSLYHAEKYTKEIATNDSGERNRERIRQNSASLDRKNPVEYLFTTSGNDD